MKIITIEHEVGEWQISYYPKNTIKYMLFIYNKSEILITRKEFKTFDEAVEWVGNNLL